MAIELLEFDIAATRELPAATPGTQQRVLVRSGRSPLGFVDIVGDGRPVSGPELMRLGRRSVGERLWTSVLASSLVVAEPERPPPPPVTIVVCTRDRASLLDGCLSTLATQDYPRFEVVVVDNAPTDTSTRTVADRHGVRYVVEARAGLDRARNTGLAEASFDLIAYTDDDARPDRAWLSGIVEGFSSDDIHCVTGLVVPAELKTRAQVLFEDVYGGMGKGFEPGFFTPGRARMVRPEWCGVGCNMAFRRGALEDIGGFDPALDVGTPTGGGGDLDAFQRILEGGGTIAYRPDAIVRHQHRRTMGELRRQFYDNGRGYVAMLETAAARSDGPGRVAVLRRGVGWVSSWLLARAVRRAFRRGEALPLRLILAELDGALRGPGLHRRSRRAVAARQ